MAALVESMMYVREKPWHGMGTRVDEAPSSKEAIELAGLNWDVIPCPVFDDRHVQIQGYWANTRNTDNSVLGIVGSRYQIVQNVEAFDFTDALIGEGLKYETAGSLRGGRQIWLLGKMPETEILGDKIEPYVCFTNTHDGSGAVRVCMTPIRVVCNNTLNVALSTAQRKWSTVHKGSVQAKLADARKTLGLMDIYLKRLAETADMLACSPFFEEDVMVALGNMLPLPKDATKRQRETNESIKDDIITCMFAPDLLAFQDTKWGFIQAVADYVDHSDPIRKTKNWQENRFASIVSGHPLLDKAMMEVGA